MVVARYCLTTLQYVTYLRFCVCLPTISQANATPVGRILERLISEGTGSQSDVYDCFFWGCRSHGFIAMNDYNNYDDDEDDNDSCIGRPSSCICSSSSSIM